MWKYFAKGGRCKMFINVLRLSPSLVQSRCLFSEGSNWTDDVFFMFMELVGKNHRNLGAVTVCPSTADSHHYLWTDTPQNWVGMPATLWLTWGLVAQKPLCKKYTARRLGFKVCCWANDPLSGTGQGPWHCLEIVFRPTVPLIQTFQVYEGPEMWIDTYTQSLSPLERISFGT